jgi:hypothetical protein
MVIPPAIAESQLAVGQRQIVEAVRVNPLLISAVPVLQRQHAGDACRIISPLERIGQLQRSPLAFPDDDRIDRRTGKEKIAGNEGRVVAAYEDRCSRDRLPHRLGGPESGIDVGGKTATDTHGVGPRRNQGRSKGCGAVEAHVHERDLVSMQLEGCPHALQAQGLDQQDPSESEPGALLWLNE